MFLATARPFSPTGGSLLSVTSSQAAQAAHYWGRLDHLPETSSLTPLPLKFLTPRDTSTRPASTLNSPKPNGFKIYFQVTCTIHLTVTSSLQLPLKFLTPPIGTSTTPVSTPQNPQPKSGFEVYLLGISCPYPSLLAPLLLKFLTPRIALAQHELS